MCRRGWPGQELPQQVHLDLQVDGHEAAAERAVDLGAVRLADGPFWITLADPAGHPFDLCQLDGAAGLQLFAVTIDAPDALALARSTPTCSAWPSRTRARRARWSPATART